MTPYTDVIEMFYRRIERDAGFFLDTGIDGDASMALAKTRADGYLTEALANITMYCHPTIDFFSHPTDETFVEWAVETGYFPEKERPIFALIC